MRWPSACKDVCRGYVTRTTCHHESMEMAVRRVGGWCEMAVSLRERELGSKGISTLLSYKYGYQSKTHLQSPKCMTGFPEVNAC
jgi:hypothetical protein